MKRPTQGILCLATSALACSMMSVPATAVEMEYRGTVTTDVQLNQTQWHSAEVMFRFIGDTNDFEHFDVATNTFLPGCGSSDLYCAIRKGFASVSISKGGETITRVFQAGQVAAVFDFNNQGVGFGAFIGPSGFEPAYPFGLDSGTTDSSAFPPPTATTNQTGKVYSCIGFGPGNYSCADPTQYPLVTTSGDKFAIFMPYHTQNPDGTIGFHFGSGSLGVGTFAMAPAPMRD